jgi:hypothetical protein
MAAYAFSAALCIGLLAPQTLVAAVATPIDIAVDINVGPGTTQPGFTPWDLTTVDTSGNEALSQQGVTFEVFGEGIFGSRNRSSFPGPGGADQALLVDFVFADLLFDCFVGLRIHDLPVGRYEMTTWHYDAHPFALAGNNHVQIEVGNQNEPGSVTVDYFPLGVAPASFGFEVCAAGQVKEILIREDDDIPRPMTTNPNQRARLNGFTLTTIVPEPAGLSLVLWPALSWLIGKRSKAARSGSCTRNARIATIQA